MESKRMSTIVWAVATFLVRLAMATDHTVGGLNGWTIGADGNTWAASQTFSVGDNLVFSYPSAFHDVVEVSKADFDNCQATKPLATFSNGITVVPLTSPGKRYFICGSPGHCKQGMKVEVNILAAAANAAPPEASPQPLTPSSLPIASPPSILRSALSPQPLLPINPGVVPALSPSSLVPPLPKVSSNLPLTPEAQPQEISPSAATSLPTVPGGLPSSSGGSFKTVGNLPSATSATNLDSPQSTTQVDSSAAGKTIILGFGFAFAMILNMF